MQGGDLRLERLDALVRHGARSRAFFVGRGMRGTGRPRSGSRLAPPHVSLRGCFLGAHGKNTLRSARNMTSVGPPECRNEGWNDPRSAGDNRRRGAPKTKGIRGWGSGARHPLALASLSTRTYIHSHRPGGPRMDGWPAPPCMHGWLRCLHVCMRQRASGIPYRYSRRPGRGLLVSL